MFITRSCLDTYLNTCQRKAYYNYFFPVDGLFRGITSLKPIYFPFGNAMHTFLESMMLAGKKGWGGLMTQETFDEWWYPYYEASFEKAKNLFLEETSKDFYDHNLPEQSEELLAYSRKEHLALLEALCYFWYKIEFQALIERYKICWVEQPILSTLATLPGNKTIKIPSRPDAIIYDTQTEEYQTVSYKTCKTTGVFSEIMQNKDLQGYLEMWATENFLKDQPDRLLDKVEAIKFVFLIKGDRREEENSSFAPKGYPVRSNPLIYGYTNGTEFAHSSVTVNLNNKSGTGRLGKGWKKFPVWREGYADVSSSKIETWIDAILDGKIQPEIDIIMKIIATPPPVVRSEFLFQETLHMTKLVASEIYNKLKLDSHGNTFFPNTKSCTFPTPCEYTKICPHSGIGYFSPDAAENVMENYAPRVSHHQVEREAFEKR